MKKIGVFNPLGVDFTIKYDINADRNPLPFTAKKEKITYFVPAVAKNMKTALVNRLLNDNWPVDKNAEAAKKKFMKQISVKTKK
jgi:hypothetical protein